MTDIKMSLLILSIALGSSHRCRESLDEIYDLDEDLYRKMTDVQVPAFNIYPHVTGEYIKKAFSIVLNEHYNDRTLLIQKLIKKGYKPAFIYFNTKSYCDLGEFALWHGEKSGGLNNVSSNYLDNSNSVILYLCTINNKKLNQSPLVDRLIKISDSMFIEDGIDSLDLKSFTEKTIENGFRFKELITYKSGIASNVGKIFEDVELKEEEDIFSGFQKGNITDKPLTKITMSITNLVKAFGMTHDVFYDTQVDEKLLINLNTFLSALSEDLEFTEREDEILYLVSLALYSIVSEYQSLRTGHYSVIKERLYEKERSLTEKLIEHEMAKKELEASYADRLELLEAELRKVQNENSKKDELIRDLITTNKKLTSELDAEISKNTSQSEGKDEQHQQVKEAITEVKTESREHVHEVLKKVNGVIIGGHPNLQNKLKELLPNFDFIKEEEKTRDISFIANRDVVFVLTGHNNHSLTDKAKSELGLTAHMINLPPMQNIDLIFSTMYTELNDILEK